MKINRKILFGLLIVLLFIVVFLLVVRCDDKNKNL